jgi:hypothetical protein
MLRRKRHRWIKDALIAIGVALMVVGAYELLTGTWELLGLVIAAPWNKSPERLGGRGWQPQIGTGNEGLSTLKWPRWVGDGEDCPECNGTGQVEDDDQEPAPIREPDGDG